MPTSRDAADYDSWVARMERPLLLAALVFVVALCAPVIWPDLHGAASLAVSAVNLGIWLLFAVDYVIRLRLVPDRKRFVRTHVIDLIVVLVPFFRPLRLLRLFSVTGLLARRGSKGLVKDFTIYVCVAASLVAFLGAVATLAVERDGKGSVLTSFSQSLWYTLSTMTAVPYGDVYPVTAEGKLISVFLMIAGLVLVGIITAAIAAWLVQFVTVEAIEDDLERIDESEQAERTELRQILERLTSIERALDARPVPSHVEPLR